MTVTTEKNFRTDVQQLQNVLDLLVQLFEKLLQALTQERVALQRRQPDLLEKLAKEIGAILAEIQKIDHHRQRITVQFGARLGVKAADVNLKALDDALGGGSGLLANRERLQKCIHDAETANRENQAIFAGVLAATESILRALKEGTQGTVASYNRRGNRSQFEAGFHFISRQL